MIPIPTSVRITVSVDIFILSAGDIQPVALKEEVVEHKIRGEEESTVPAVAPWPSAVALPVHSYASEED